MPFSIILPAISAVFVLLICVFAPQFAGLTFTIKPDVFDANSVASILFPAVIASLFIERAAEIFVISLRKGTREVKESALSELKNKITNADDETTPTLLEEEQVLDAQIKNYKRETVQWASAFSIVFSLLVVVVGIRLLSPFFDITYIDCLSGVEIIPEECPSGIENIQGYYDWFVRVDIFISTFVIAGGAAGIHSVVSAITSFADSAKQANSPK
jgi:Na+-driven multidrug efflux pump